MTPTTWQRTEPRPTGGSITSTEQPSETRLDVTSLREDWAQLRDQTRILHSDTTDGHHRIRRQDLEQRAAQHNRRPLPDVLEELSDLGFSWRDIARALGVSVPALRKWRHGEPATPANRTRTSRFLAVCEYLSANVPTLTDVAGWFEMPLVDDPAITPLDLFAGAREDLVLDYGEEQEPDPAALLDRYDPAWRERRSDFEAIIADDGLPTIQLRR